MRVDFSKGATEDAYKIRREVFIEEQKFTIDKDEIDERAYHVVIYDEDIPIATGRCFSKEDKKDEYIIGRVAVLKKYRGLKIGREVILLLEGKIKELNGKSVELSAQVRAKNFYEKIGYVEYGEVYFDEYCEHIKMKKIL